MLHRVVYTSDHKNLYSQKKFKIYKQIKSDEKGCSETRINCFLLKYENLENASLVYLGQLQSVFF